MSLLFVSHAHDDLPLVDAFVDLLENGVGIDPRQIFCSSRKGQGIKLGKDFVSSIHEALRDARCAIALISENYYASAFCMCELGGVWLQQKDFLPVLVPPVDYKALKAILQGMQVSKIDDQSELDELRDELAARLDIEPLPTPRWNDRRESFFKNLAGVLAKIETKGPVPRETYGKVEAELKEYNKQRIERRSRP